MIKLSTGGVFLINGTECVENSREASEKIKRLLGRAVSESEARKGTVSYGVLAAHNSGDGENLRLKFDSLTSHDITYVGIIQTARACGIEKFPVPYVLTNCHNSLCAVGGTINEDDHMFALSAAKKYGGVFVPPNLAVLHSYNREMMAGGGKMILGSDSHTRYGALGTLAIGEGGGELAKQLVGKTYDIARPEVVGVYLSGRPGAGVGPQDVALAIIGAVYGNGYVKNKIMEFIGGGVSGLSVEYRNGIDVMTTETACLSSVWQTDGRVKEYLDIHRRPGDYRELAPSAAAYYDGMIYVDLSKIEPMIALPFHPSNVYTIRELKANARDIFAQAEKDCLAAIGVPGLSLNLQSKIKGGDIYVEQGIVAGCSGGTFENIAAVADILGGRSIGNGAFKMSVYPGSQPAYMELIRNGSVEKIMGAGALVRSAFCGPCFGAGDTPANGELSVRHTTRNFPNREGSKPGDGQLASVALMDARSVAATAVNGGRLTSAAEIDIRYSAPRYYFDKSVYGKRVYDGAGRPMPQEPLVFGPNIKDWPEMPALPENLLVKLVCYITDPVTTTDELIPSGESSSYRSNPGRMAEFTLSRKDPGYVGRAKAVRQIELDREGGKDILAGEMKAVFEKISALPGCGGVSPHNTGIGSAIYAHKPGDGSAREQAASCQRVLGGWANIAGEYATKRYRSNLINWGLVPLLSNEGGAFESGDWVLLPGLREAILGGSSEIAGFIIKEDGAADAAMSLGALTDTERRILADGCLINHWKHEA